MLHITLVTISDEKSQESTAQQIQSLGLVRAHWPGRPSAVQVSLSCVYVTQERSFSIWSCHSCPQRPATACSGAVKSSYLVLCSTIITISRLVELRAMCTPLHCYKCHWKLSFQSLLDMLSIYNLISLKKKNVLPLTLTQFQL